jgi:hypothetical protein
MAAGVTEANLEEAAPPPMAYLCELVAATGELHGIQVNPSTQFPPAGQAPIPPIAGRAPRARSPHSLARTRTRCAALPALVPAGARATVDARAAWRETVWAGAAPVLPCSSKREGCELTARRSQRVPGGRRRGRGRERERELQREPQRQREPPVCLLPARAPARAACAAGARLLGSSGRERRRCCCCHRRTGCCYYRRRRCG